MKQEMKYNNHMNTTICAHPDRPVKAKGLCGACYGRQHREAGGNKRRALCHSARPHRAKGWCAACYLKQLREGSVGQFEGKYSACGHFLPATEPWDFCSGCTIRMKIISRAAYQKGWEAGWTEGSKPRPN